MECWNVSFTRDIEQMVSLCHSKKIKCFFFAFQKSSFADKRSIAALFCDFLHYYAYEFNFAYEVVQIRTQNHYDKEVSVFECLTRQLLKQKSMF